MDFSPITGLTVQQLLVVVNAKKIQAKTIAELTAVAKKDSSRLTYGWGGSSPLVAVEQYKQMAGDNLQSVPYKSNPQATTDLVAGRIDLK